jgi:hypothetical protein
MPIENGLIKLDSTEAWKAYSRIRNAETAEYVKFCKDCADNEKFAQGADNQWTAEEIEALDRRGGYRISMDLTRKAIQSIVGLFTANKPTFKAIPVDDESSKISSMANRLLDYTYRTSDGQLTNIDILNSAYRSNIAYAYVYPYKNSIKYTKLTYNQVIVDPNSKDMLFRDADYIWIKKWVPIEKVKALYNIETLSSMPVDIVSSTYSMGFDTKQLYDNTRQYMLIYEGYRKMIVNDNGERYDRIIRETLIGYEYMFREVLPKDIQDYPIIPVYSELNDNPYKRSEMHYMKDPQRFINKMYNITIMNAQATGSSKLVVRTTDIPGEDLEAFSDRWSIPGSVNEINPGAEAPVVVGAQPLSNAFFTLYQDAVRHLFTVYSSLGLDTPGQDSSQVDTNATLFEKREAVMDSLRIASSIYTTFLSQLGKCIIQGYAAYIDNDVVVKILNASEIMGQIDADRKAGLDVRDEESVKTWMEARSKEGVPEEEMKEYIEEAKDRAEYIETIIMFTDGKVNMDVEIEVVKDSYAPTFEASRFSMALNLAKLGAIDPDTLLEMAPLDEKEKIIKRIGKKRLLESKVQELTDQLEKLSQELEKKDKEIEKSTKDQIKLKEEARFDKLYGDQRAKSYVNKQQLGMDRQLKNNELEYKVKEYLLSLKEQEVDKLLENIDKKDKDSTDFKELIDKIYY